MKTTEYVTEILNELHRSAAYISDEEADQLADHILSSNQIFTAGAGRSGLMAKSFAMRLMHMGFNAHIVGEILTPPLRKGDLVIIGSGSGETKSLIHTAAKANSLDGVVAALTINPESSHPENKRISSSTCPVLLKTSQTEAIKPYSQWDRYLSKLCCCSMMQSF